MGHRLKKDSKSVNSNPLSLPSANAQLYEFLQCIALRSHTSAREPDLIQISICARKRLNNIRVCEISVGQVKAET